MRSLIARQGGDPTVAPSMREIPLEENDAAFEFAEKLLAGRIDAVLFLTGVGAQALLDALKLRHDETVVLAALDRAFVAVRGPKPTAVLKKWGVHIDVKAPEPNTWRETAAAIRAAVDLHGKTVAVQEYGKPNEALYDELRALGADVLPVPVYRWALPEDTAPLEAALRASLSDGFDIYAFTSAQQVENVLTVVRQLGFEDELRTAMRRSVIVSIGPTCSEALREHGLPPDIEASPPKMGPMVRSALEQGRDAITRKRSSGAAS
ncbi:MAG: uroporphyrinogen-III synthase [Planctomycetaceae bacterium]|nr:uroporphyrinogen-III synthase [Planctomycetaceae bacterium]